MASSINASTSGAGGVITTADATGILNLQTAGTTAVTIDASQNVGIGTTSPSGKLDVTGTVYGGKNGTQGYIGIQGSGDTAHTGYIEFLAPNGTRKGYIGYADISGSGQFNIWGESSTNALAFATNSTERMRIDSSGNVLTGTTTASNSSGVGGKYLASATAPSYSLVGSSSSTDVSYVLYSTGAAAYRFYVQYDGKIYATNTTITGISDIRLKENIRDLDEGLDTVLSLKPRKFDWKEGKGKDIKNDRGFIAQEFEEVLPDLIDEWKDTPPEGEKPYKSVRADLIPVLVKAIQEQQTIINDLKARVTALEAK